MKRKILILPSWYPSDDSPVAGIFIQEQALVLSREYDVAILAPRLVGFRQTLRGHLGLKSQMERRLGLIVCRERALAPVPRAPALAYVSYAQAARRGFEKLLATWGKPEIIHAHVVLPGGWAAVRLGNQYSIPVVLTEHSSSFPMRLKTQYHRRLVRKILTQATRVIAVSPVMAQQIRAFQSAVEVKVIGNVINTRFFSPSEHSGEASLESTTRFLSVALLTEGKGISYLLEAAQLLVQRGYESFELLIGGDG